MSVRYPKTNQTSTDLNTEYTVRKNADPEDVLLSTSVDHAIDMVRTYLPVDTVWLGGEAFGHVNNN